MGNLLENDNNGTADAEYIEIPGTAEDITEMEKTIDEELNSIFSEFGGDDRDTVFKIRVSRVIKDQGQEEICFYCMPQELPIFDRIKNEYGPGMYKVTVFKNNLKFRNRSLNIAAPIKQPATEAAGNSGQDLTTIFTAMAEMQQKNFEQMQSLLARQPAPAAPAPAGNPLQMLIDLAPAIVAIKGLFPAQTNGVDMMLKGMEMMKDFQPDSGGGEKNFTDFMITAAKEFGGPLIEMAKTLPAMPAVNPAAAQPPAQIETQPQQENDSMLMLKMQVNNFVSQAAAGKDPALYADLILDNMTPEQINEFLGQPNLKEFLIGLNPKVSDYWPWFERLQSEVMAGLVPPEDLTTNNTGADTADITPISEPAPDASDPAASGDATSDK
jgi:hypothetical protein